MTINKLPLYVKLSLVLVGIFVFFDILFLGKSIIVPLIFAWILAILLNPVVNFFTRVRIPRVLAIVTAILLLIVVVFGVFYFIETQTSKFSSSLPQLKQRSQELINQCLAWVTEKFHIERRQINSWVAEQKQDGMKSASNIIGNTLEELSAAVVVILLLPVYIFLFLFYKPLLLNFIAQLFAKEQHTVVGKVVNSITKLIQNYLVGLLIEMVIVATLNATVLLIIGIKYAILLGVIGALLNLIPYIGGIIAISMPMLMAIIEGKPLSALYVLGGYLLVQLIDNNFLVPKIVASKVRVNALVSIVVVLIGGALWGVAGMFLSIPLTAIAKVTFDHVDSLKPFGFLIGDNMPRIGKSIFSRKEKRPDVNTEKKG